MVDGHIVRKNAVREHRLELGHTLLSNTVKLTVPEKPKKLWTATLPCVQVRFQLEL